jgi:hypothetical protein
MRDGVWDRISRSVINTRDNNNVLRIHGAYLGHQTGFHPEALGSRRPRCIATNATIGAISGSHGHVYAVPGIAGEPGPGFPGTAGRYLSGGPKQGKAGRPKGRINATLGLPSPSVA